jgi:transposase
MDNNLQIPLNLPNVRIVEVCKTDKQDWLIKVESTLNQTNCHKCGEPTTEFHCWGEPVRLRHLPLFEIPVYIELRPKRYRCPRCEGHPTTTQELSWYLRRSPNTKAYEEWLLRLLVNSTVTDVACKLSVGQDVVIGVIERWIETSVDWEEFETIEVIGIDEIALKRGHRNFVALVTTATERGVEILAVLQDRTKETVGAFLGAIPSRLQKSINTVCTDMYLGYVNAAKEQLPNAKIVIDRFHVAKAYRDCADAVRKKETRRLRQELSSDEYDKIKGLMWTFRQRPENVSAEERIKLKKLFDYSPQLQKAYRLREELTAIFDGNYTKVGAKNAIQAWRKRVCEQGMEAFESFLTTLDNWLDEITNYFLDGQTSGFVEGFNNRVKVLKRRCYGIFDIQHIFQRLTLDVKGYERYI